MTSIEKSVHDALERALANGYDMTRVSPHEVATDLLDMDSEVAELTAGTATEPEDAAEALVPHVVSWQVRRVSNG